MYHQEFATKVCEALGINPDRVVGLQINIGLEPPVEVTVERVMLGSEGLFYALSHYDLHVEARAEEADDE